MIVKGHRLSGSFHHVVKTDHISGLNDAIRTDGINCVFSPLEITPLALGYINGLDLSKSGEFAHIINPYGHDPSIGPWKSLFFSEFITDPKNFDPDILYTQMTEFPERSGKTEFAELVCEIANAFWPARGNPEGMSLSIMQKFAATNPLFHLDDGTTRRGLVTLRGNEQKGATKIICNDATDFWQRQPNGYPFLNPIGEAGKDFAVEDHQIMHIPLRHMSIHEGVKHKMRPGFLEHVNEDGLREIYTELYLIDIMAEQNPLGHSEPSAGECPEPRLQIMLN